MICKKKTSGKFLFDRYILNLNSCITVNLLKFTLYLSDFYGIKKLCFNKTLKNSHAKYEKNLNVSVPNKRASKYMMYILTDLKEEIDKTTFITGNTNTPSDW